MPSDHARRARDLDRKGARRTKGPALALAVVLAGVVASVATAALMVHGVQSLGDASATTADRATAVPGRVVVHSAHAVHAGGDVSSLHLYVGSDGGDIDLAGLVVRVERLQDAQQFRYGSDALEVIAQRDPDGSVTAPAPGLNRGDLVELVLHVDGSGLGLGSGDRFVLRWHGSAAGTPAVTVLVPSVGAGTLAPLSLA